MNKGLTSFRAYAFLAVFFYHMLIVKSGYLGVQAFFVLSGFLLTPILLNMKANLGHRDYLVNFYGRRALRIFPLYYLFLVVVGGIFLVLSSVQTISDIPFSNAAIKRETNAVLDQIVWAFTYCMNFKQATDSYQPSYVIGLFWSLAVEEQFYLIWPLLLYFIPKQHIKKFLILSILFGPLIRFITWTVAENDLLPHINERSDHVVYFLPFSYIDAFAIGGFFSLYQKSRSSLYTWLVIAIAIGLGFFAEYMSVGEVKHLSGLGYFPYMSDSYKHVWGYSVMNLVFAMILIQVRDGRFCRVLFENPVAYYLGQISYGMYVFHYAIIWAVTVSTPGSSTVTISVIALSLTVLISMLSYELMEKRIIGLKDKYFPSKSSESVTQLMKSTNEPSSEPGKEYRKKTPTWLIGASTILLVVGINGVSGKTIFDQFFVEKKPDQIDIALIQFSNDENAILPKMLNAETRLDKTVAHNKTFQYNYTLVNRAAAEVNPEAITNALQKKFLYNLCTSESMKTFVTHNIPVLYAYFGNDGKEITKIKVQANQCRKG